MDGIDDALERRVGDLLGHLDEMPEMREALPFTVRHLVGRLEAAYSSTTPARGAHAGAQATTVISS